MTWVYPPHTTARQKSRIFSIQQVFCWNVFRGMIAYNTTTSLPHSFLYQHTLNTKVSLPYLSWGNVHFWLEEKNSFKTLDKNSPHHGLLPHAFRRRAPTLSRFWGEPWTQRFLNRPSHITGVTWLNQGCHSTVSLDFAKKPSKEGPTPIRVTTVSNKQLQMTCMWSYLASSRDEAARPLCVVDVSLQIDCSTRLSWCWSSIHSLYALWTFLSSSVSDAPLPVVSNLGLRGSADCNSILSWVQVKL